MPKPQPGTPVRGSQSGRPIMALLDLLGRRWAMRALWEIDQAPCSFRDLQERCGQISSSVLNARLAELREAALVDQGEQGYELTALGQELMQHLAPLRRWADKWGKQLPASDE